ncbi:MAG TPA: ornithine carbamoyltransferase [Alphaproteobacteria bacterium]
MPRHLLRTLDLSPAALGRLLDLAAHLKADPFARADLLRNQTVVLYFNKPSTRTRISFETAIARLGGTPIAVGAAELQLGRGETIEDTARTISRYARAFVIRTYSDADVARFAAASTIPVINGLTDRHHPCQSLADLMTLRERRATLKGCRLAFVGDGDNVCHSLIEAAALSGMALSVATPPGYAPAADIVADAQAAARRSGATISIGHDPVAAVAGAEAVYTDTWMSMNVPESERAPRLKAFAPYQVNAALMARARGDAMFMHCLPDHRGEEVTAEVIDGPQSVVFDQAENRLHTAAAILSALVESPASGPGPRA